MTKRILPPRGLAERAARTDAVIARFRAKPFDWSAHATCIHLFRAQAAAFGHKVPLVPRFKTPLGARRALERTGFATVEALIDSMLPRIAPATMWVGDIALLPGEPFEAVTVHAGGGILLGWHADAPDRLRPIEGAVAQAIAAYRL